jgi:DNA repair protein RecN (Recombination protein N)
MPLKRITLRDFVIVRELELDLDGGFSVLTGETGAGKSILIDALQLALGARADAGVVREGAARTDISAEFDLPPALTSWLAEAGFESEDSLLLRRTIDSQGKSRAWINGSPATATQLREVADQLVDIHGQHAWQSLTRADAVRALLDGYAGVTTETLQQSWHRWRAAQRSLTDARAAQDSLQRERERLAWQIGEVDKLSPGAGEWDELNTSHTRLANAQSLLEAAQAAIEALEADEAGATQRLSQAQAVLQAQVHVEPAFAELAQVLASSLAQAEDAAHSLHAYLRKTDLDPQRLEELDTRMSLWMSLARRYKRTPPELPGLLGSWKQELAKKKRPMRTWPKRGGCQWPGPRPRRNLPTLSRTPCKASACRAGALKWRYTSRISRPRAGWTKSLSWWPPTRAVRRGRWARWRRAASCRASRSRSP